VAEELTYKRLRDLCREEKAQPGLVSLAPEFYSSIEEFLSSRFSEMESTRSVMQMREFENAVATIKEISSIRQQKILFKAIRSGGSHATGEMTREEHELYDRFCAVLEDESQRMAQMLSRFESGRGRSQAARQPQQEAAKPGAEENNFKKVRFIKDVPAYKGANNETFGPFKPGEESALPKTEADWLLRGKLAEDTQ
jgi:DNA replication initiation complex subunit (GINS family)